MNGVAGWIIGVLITEEGFTGGNIIGVGTIIGAIGGTIA